MEVFLAAGPGCIGSALIAKLACTGGREHRAAKSPAHSGTELLEAMGQLRHDHRRAKRQQGCGTIGNTAIGTSGGKTGSEFGRVQPDEEWSMDPSQLSTLLAEHKWFAAIALLVTAIVRLLKSDTQLPWSVPAQWRAWLAIGLGVVGGILDALVSGTSIVQALLQRHRSRSHRDCRSRYARRGSAGWTRLVRFQAKRAE